MKYDSFFKPTPLYKELMILQLISNQEEDELTQRKIAKYANVSLAMVNSYLDDYEHNGIVKRVYNDNKSFVKYKITKKGEERKRLLNIQYLESALDVYNQAKNECANFLKEIINKGFRNILFYGAGEVAEIMLYVINNTQDLELKVLAIIDDDINKQNGLLTNTKIININDIDNYQYDGILISSYTNSKVINEKLQSIKFDKNKIIRFFE